MDEVDGLGTSLFDLSLNPDGTLWVSNIEARDDVRFEHPLGVRGHVVDNRLSIVDPGPGHPVTIVDLNGHVDRQSDPATNLAERLASVSQPGMLVWNDDGSVGYLVAIGTRKVFRVDGACRAPGCIFGASGRAAPDAVEVGEGPTGIAYDGARDRLYVLGRVSHSISVVEASTLTALDEVALHGPSDAATRAGRRFLYDAIDASGHGDASCASCHLSGDTDGLAWDLGDPTGALVPYDTPLDNVRFVVPQSGQPVECDASACADHDGFDPQKGPMATQTLRGMLEPLHWRGDRATMLDFNSAFVTLLGGEDVGSGAPAGLTPEDMATFREFALGIRLPPNPYLELDGSTPCPPRGDPQDPDCEVTVHGLAFPGNPTEGRLLFDDGPRDAGQPCDACHAFPFGTAGGALGGVAPTEPTSPQAAALFFGAADASDHSDLKIPHLRTMYDKPGPVWADPGSSSLPLLRSTFGYTHDGSVPDLYRFLSINVFTLSAANAAQEVRDIASFLFHFDTGTPPATGVQVTLPAGPPSEPTTADEELLAALVALGDAADGDRRCELYATAAGGAGYRAWFLSARLWQPDAAADAPLSTTDLRLPAAGPLTFTCAPLGSGARLGADLATLRVTGVAAFDCLAGGVAATQWADPSGVPAPGAGVAYLVRARNECGAGALGPGREALDALECAPP